MKASSGTLVLTALTLVFLIAGVGVGVGAHLSSTACEDRAAAMGVPYTWDLGSGCYVEIEPRKWVSADSL